jgi:hypothetical protein
VFEGTRGTAIAALEAKRNEEQVLAEGALLGERRVAWIRLAMIAMFGIISNLRPMGTSFEMKAFGFAYTVLSIGTLIQVHRLRANPIRTRTRPMIVATGDWAFITIQGLLDVKMGGFDRGMAAIASALILSWAVARWPLRNVIYSIVWAPISFGIVCASAGALD